VVLPVCFPVVVAAAVLVAAAPMVPMVATLDMAEVAAEEGLVLVAVVLEPVELVDRQS